MNKRQFLILTAAAGATSPAIAAPGRVDLSKQVYREQIGGVTLTAKRPLPPTLRWLEAPSAPAHLKLALAELGRTQVKGAAAPFIDAWVEELGCSPVDTQRYWCGVFAGVVLKRAGFTPPKAAPKAVRWDTFGAPVAKGGERLGDVVVLNRQAEGKGHIGFYVGQDETHFHLLGGNQGDGDDRFKVSIKTYFRDVHRFSRRPVS